MLGIFLIQLPFSVCVVWCLIVLFKKQKKVSDRLVMWIMGLLAFSFFCGSHHMDANPDYELLAIYDVILQFSSLAVFPIVCIYIKNCYEENEVTWVPYLSTIPSLILLVVSIVLTAIIGLPRCGAIVEMLHSGVLPRNLLSPLDNAYITFTFQAYYVTFYLSLSISLIYIISKLFIGKFRFKHISAFLRGQKASFIANVVCLSFVIFFVLWGLSVIFSSVFANTFSVWTPIWSFVASCVLFLVGYVTAIPSLPGGYVTLERLRHPFSAMHQSTQEYLQGIDSGPMAGAGASGFEKIMDSFRQHMEKEQGFLNPTLTIEEIAHKLNSNRTYVSKLVNMYYGMPFRDYLNKLRLDYSKQLMTDEPDASLEYIAVKSGFQSSTQFIRKFRETEGVTPTTWKTLQGQKK